MSLAPPDTSVDNIDQSQLIGSGITQTTPCLSQSGQTLSEKLYIGLEFTPLAFNLRDKIIGPAGANLQYINKETDVQISLRGIGSLYIEPNTNDELQEPLHLLLEHHCHENINCAIQLTKNLIETLHKEFQQFQQNIESQVLLPNISLSNVKTPIPPTSLPFSHHQLPAMQQQQQLIPQSGLQMQIAQNGFIMQHTPSYAANVQLPLAHTSLLPMKSTNRIQVQLAQANSTNPQLPALLAAQNTPILLNTQTQPMQYQQYIQQTTRDLQGNQHITLQPIIQHTRIPLQSPHQFITVQHGNATYMIPHGSAIMQQTPASQLSIIHHQHQLPSTYLNPTQIHVQLPTVNIQQLPVHSGASQLPSQVQLSSNETTSNSSLAALPTSSTSLLLDEIASTDSNSQDVVAEVKLYQDIDKVSAVDDNTECLSDAQPKYVTYTNVPRQHINCFSLPSYNVHQFIGGNSLSIPVRTVFPASSPIERVNFIGNSQQIQAPANAQTSIIRLQQLHSIAQQQQQQQQQPVAVTFTQPVIQQSHQQFIEIQPPPPVSQQQFDVIRTNPFNTEKSLQQQQLQQQQHLLHCSQQEEPTQQQQQQPQQQMSLDVTSTTKTLNRRCGQKRKQPNCEPTDDCSVVRTSPNQKLRSGARPINDAMGAAGMSPVLATTRPRLAEIDSFAGLCFS